MSDFSRFVRFFTTFLTLASVGFHSFNGTLKIAKLGRFFLTSGTNETTLRRPLGEEEQHTHERGPRHLLRSLVIVPTTANNNDFPSTRNHDDDIMRRLVVLFQVACAAALKLLFPPSSKAPACHTARHSRRLPARKAGIKALLAVLTVHVLLQLGLWGAGVERALAQNAKARVCSRRAGGNARRAAATDSLLVTTLFLRVGFHAGHLRIGGVGG